MKFSIEDGESPPCHIKWTWKFLIPKVEKLQKYFKSKTAINNEKNDTNWTSRRTCRMTRELINKSYVHLNLN